MDELIDYDYEDNFETDFKQKYKKPDIDIDNIKCINTFFILKKYLDEKYMYNLGENLTSSNLEKFLLNL